MTTLTTPIAQLPEFFRPLRRVEFERMAELGLFEDDVRIELVGGVLIEMPPPSPQHIGMQTWLTRELVLQCGRDYVVSPQNPLAVDDFSEPLPDVTVMPNTELRHLREIQAEALLVIEVAMSSLRFDLGEKARRYAAAGYPEYWVVDVDRRVIHVHRDPRPDGRWASVVPMTEGRLTAVAVPPVAFEVADILGSSRD